MNKIQIQLGDEALSAIRRTSNELGTSMSKILREVLKNYKKSYKAKDKTIKKDGEEYSQNVSIRPTIEVSSKEYSFYAESISNEDIIIFCERLKESLR